MANIDLAELLNATQAAAAADGNPLRAFLLSEADGDSFRIWVENFSAHGKPATLPLRQYLAQQVALMDELIEEQVNAILHHSRFQKGYLTLHLQCVHLPLCFVGAHMSSTMHGSC